MNATELADPGMLVIDLWPLLGENLAKPVEAVVRSSPVMLGA
jgi:hypothetical protein